MPVYWKLKEYLRAHGFSAYQFWQASGLAKGTAYRLVNGQTTTVNTATLDAAMRALRRLTGRTIEMDEILEWAED